MTTPPSPWNEIASAPKDGTVLLLVRHDGRIVVGRWDPDKYSKKPRPYWKTDLTHLWGLRDSRENPPTHWMNLPNPPTTSNPGEGE